MKIIKLPVGGITIELDTVDPESIMGKISSNLQDNSPEPDGSCLYNAAIDGIESLILAHACAGVNVEDPAYLEGIQTAIDAITNNLA